MALLTTPNQIGVREDLANFISRVDAASTPFVSMAPKGKELGNVKFEWLVDDYDAAVVTGTVDGADVSTYVDPADGRARLSNYGQLFRRNGRVSILAQEVSNVAGIGKKGERARGIAKNMVELKRDMEKTMLGTANGQLDAGGSTPYLTAALGKWLEPSGGSPVTVPVNMTTGNPANYVTPTASVNTAATTATLTDTDVQAVLKSIYDTTGQIRNFTGICGTTIKRSFTNFTSTTLSLDATGGTTGSGATAIRSFNQELGASVFRNRIDVFEGDFGTITLVPDTFMPTATDAYIVPMDLVEIRYGLLPRVKDLPDSGGGPAWLVEAFAGLCVKNPLAFGKFDLAS